jgi:hypothetical protein
VNLPVLQKVDAAYKLWHSSLSKIPRLSRYTLGAKIDLLFVELIESLLLAGYAKRQDKLGIIVHASTKLDLLKFFLQTAWEMKILENSVYARVSDPVNEIGRILGGWRKRVVDLSKRPPAHAGGFCLAGYTRGRSFCQRDGCSNAIW